MPSVTTTRVKMVSNNIFYIVPVLGVGDAMQSHLCNPHYRFWFCTTDLLIHAQFHNYFAQ